ncbi:MAG: FdhF/YdeP family oxidoreductase [Deltaproteobacteria bacterium]|nr:FdhF/YdeP family oxidoreductase [Deltaproteobacteria bacterium]
MADESRSRRSTPPAPGAEGAPRPYPPAAAGPGAVLSSLRYAWQTSGPLRALRVLTEVNQRDGFDCPGCAWPDPGHRSLAEFCENGARAVTHEADRRRVDRAFFAAHSLAALRAETDHWLEQQGRLVEPMVRRPGRDRYEPIAWDDALALAGDALRGLASPDEAAFYTSGRASNEAAFLYQLFARSLGTNNLPDCSNLCHESSGKALLATLGVGKGTVQLDDFEKADLILILGQNPGTNHPRMLSTLAAAAERGAAIVSVNPLRERALEHFAHPQTVLGMVGEGTRISSQYVQVRINGDVALLKGVMKLVLAEERKKGGVLDRAFLEEHTVGFAELLRSIDEASWDAVLEGSGVPMADIERLARTYLEAERVIACWAMGLTQHKNAVSTIREVVNLLALRGNLGREGAGVCPVRGHSNVQGDRTVGIDEAPTEAFLARLDAGTGIRSPRRHGYDVVDTIRALEDGRVKVFVALGGNFVAATPDTPRTAAALRKARLTVQIATKLNRSHLETGETALLLPCLGRSERDVQDGHPQFVTVENSMGVVHRSAGKLEPASPELRSEPWIVAHLAAATLGERSIVAWLDLARDHDRIRDLIERSVAGFERYNERVRAPDGFLLPNAARERRWETASGKARLGAESIPRIDVQARQLVMMTLRSHDQFNTTVYGLDDRYRGIHGERRIVFVNRGDREALGFEKDAVVDVTSHHEGRERAVRGFRLVDHDIPRGNCASYFPEANPLVPLESQADESGTPTSKSFVVSLAPNVALP